MIDRVKSSPVARRVWGSYRRHLFRREYISRRESYHRQARISRLWPNPDSLRVDVSQRLAKRNYIPEQKRLGDVHTFAFLPLFSWHQHLIPDLERLGPLTQFDYTAFGFERSEFTGRNRSAGTRRDAMNEVGLEGLRRAHGRRPVDWVFMYGNGRELGVRFLERVHEEFGVPVVNMCLDDKQSWEREYVGGQRAGQVDIAPLIDLNWTSSTLALEWYRSVGATAMYLPEGFNADHFKPCHAKQDIDVSFVGADYGFRREIVRALRKYDIAVVTYGNGWRNGPAPDCALPVIFSRSKINLGMGGIGYEPHITNVKGRDFDIPGSGGGIYLTTYSPDLARHFDIGSEIACYLNDFDMVETIRYFLARPREAADLSARARRRSLAEHRWLHRYVSVLETIGILATEDTSF